MSTKIEHLGQFLVFLADFALCYICCETIETKPQLNALFVTNSENTYFSFDLLDLVLTEQCYSEVLHLPYIDF